MQDTLSDGKLCAIRKQACGKEIEPSVSGDVLTLL